MLLTGKNAIVTGSNRGIGRAIVEAFAQNGACVWAHARKNTPEFEADMSELATRYEVEIWPIFFDVTDSDAMKTTVKSLMSSRRPVNVLVNNVGVAHGGLFQMTSAEKLREVFDVNFFAAMEFSQLIARLMQRTKNGSIINIASIAGLDLKAGNVAYGASKAALIAATKTLAAELSIMGIRVNAIAPGLTDTTMAKLMDEKAGDEMLRSTALKRLAQPNEIANVVTFFASNLSSFVSGQVLRVDGGSC